MVKPLNLKNLFLSIIYLTAIFCENKKIINSHADPTKINSDPDGSKSTKLVRGHSTGLLSCVR